MARRKTVDVKKLTEWVNDKLASDSLTVQEKFGFINVIDHVLNETGNYSGYGYYDSYDAETWTPEQDVKRFYYLKG